jgi:hypothetical protein
MPLVRDDITIDEHAIRHGETAVGYIIVYPDISNVFLGVNNKLYKDKEKAVRHAMTMDSHFRPIVKAVRAAEEDEPDAGARSDCGGGRGGEGGAICEGSEGHELHPTHTGVGSSFRHYEDETDDA